ncbi:MAG TPA: hypothetical protein VIM57_05825 [Luteolibacter sp.]
MKCPRCVQKIHRAADGCPHCGFSLTDAKALFGVEAVRSRSLTDAAGLVRLDDRPKIEKTMAGFNRRFPQFFVAVHTGSFRGVANLRQFGFWLLNQAAFEDVPLANPNEGGILLTIDAESKSAGITFGYRLDAFLTEEDTFLCLSRAHAYWLEGRYADGIVRAIAQLEKILIKRSRQAWWNPKKFARRVAKPVQPDAGPRKMREGHRAARKEVRR